MRRFLMPLVLAPSLLLVDCAKEDCAALAKAGPIGQFAIAVSGAILDGAVPGSSNFSCNNAVAPYEPESVSAPGGVCSAAIGDDACTACIKASCCDLVLACYRDDGCACILDCRSAGSDASCSNCGDTTAFDVAIDCTREHCAEQCPGAD